ncbi:DNA/RNA non-specific endonuclease [Halosquirtibacter xylanolyticus]|uniref:DNA/RNA non-specific endonuclease n=1 Tax=Halosquirtibacter xylanolyticus TaxID=3374599 RepID=UPI003747B5F4|nr:DNA/RNA non-specific endonuclease [Prolixibacteraceae bacterium]
MKRFFPILLLLLGSFANVIAQDSKHLPKDSQGRIVKHTNYTLNYIEKYEQPSWVAYELTKTELSKHLKRTDNFRPDPKVSTHSAGLSDYRGSGYDRGHLAPAADMAFTSQAMSESFFLSNMSPQHPKLNRGQWRLLEEQVRRWAKKEGKVYIVTGPVLKPGLKTIGKNRVAIPQYYYKIIYDLTPPKKAIAFLMPNSECSKGFMAYQTSIDKIEKLTHIDFFAELKDSEENQMEASVSKQWKTNTTNHNYKPKASQSNKVNINTASQKRLMTLPGIGEKFAKEIIRHRPYSSIYELKKIKGIGDKTVAKIKPHITK